MRLFPKKPSKPGSPARQTLEAAIARRASRTPSIEEDEEPTTSFKTALVVVLLLHVVAGGGILMFDRIKTRRPNALETAATAKTASQPVAAPVAVHLKSPEAAAPGQTVKKPAPALVPVHAAAEVKDSGKIYTVAKGENPGAIARKLHVGYDDLLKLNKIDDPKNIRIGKKLHVPVKPRAAAN